MNYASVHPPNPDNTLQHLSTSTPIRSLHTPQRMGPFRSGSPRSFTANNNGSLRQDLSHSLTQCLPPRLLSQRIHPHLTPFTVLSRPRLPPSLPYLLRRPRIPPPVRLHQRSRASPAPRTLSSYIGQSLSKAARSHPVWNIDSRILVDLQENAGSSSARRRKMSTARRLRGPSLSTSTYTPTTSTARGRETQRMQSPGPEGIPWVSMIFAIFARRMSRS